MNTLIAYTPDRVVNISRTIDQFVFDFYVKKKASLTTCLVAFQKEIVRNTELKFNRAWFTEKRLEEDVLQVWSRFEEQKRTRLSKRLKGESLTDIVMNLFKNSDNSKIFISQNACAEVLQTNQMAVSREIKELVEKDILVLVQRGSNLTKACSVYSLGQKGLSLFNSLFAKVIEKVEEFKEISTEQRDKLLKELAGLQSLMKLGTSKFLENPKTKANLDAEEAIYWKKVFEGS